MGKCMYSGEKIELSDLFDENKYDLDHIFPRSVTKDDSLQNLVLVKRELNAEKADTYPLSDGIRAKQHGFWNYLHQKGLISDKKLNRLTRTSPFTAEELTGFVARQLVETNQAAKATIQLFRQLYPDTAIIFSKAENVTDFRHEQDFIKVRSINDFHHAKDAYLNIVVGNVYHEKFTNNIYGYIQQHMGKRDYNLAKMFDKKISVKGKVIWNPDIDMPMVTKMMRSNDVRVTRRAMEQKGSLFKATIYKKGQAKAEGYAPLKANGPLADVTKYGGYRDISTSHYCIVEGINKKEKIEVRIVPIPVMLIDSLQMYVVNYLSKRNVVFKKFLFNKLCIGYKVYSDGFF